MNKPAPWRTLHSDYVVDTPFLRLRRDRIQLPDGTIIEDYYVRESHGFTIVFAMTPDDRVVLVHQYKHGIGEYVLELPAGAIDPNEDPLVCAERELAEETGYVSDKPLELVRTFITDPTNSDSRFHLFLARDCEVRVAQEFDATEDIRVELVTLPELRVMVRDGRINVNSHVASIYTVLDSLRPQTDRRPDARRAKVKSRGNPSSDSAHTRGVAQTDEQGPYQDRSISEVIAAGAPLLPELF